MPRYLARSAAVRADTWLATVPAPTERFPGLAAPLCASVGMLLPLPPSSRVSVLSHRRVLPAPATCGFADAPLS